MWTSFLKCVLKCNIKVVMEKIITCDKIIPSNIKIISNTLKEIRPKVKKLWRKQMVVDADKCRDEH